MSIFLREFMGIPNHFIYFRFKILTVPILQTLPFAKIFKNVYGDLLAQSVEGFVITVPCKGAIFKWKGYEDNDPRRVESLIEISGKKIWKTPDFGSG